jgi:hypothetical protein
MNPEVLYLILCDDVQADVNNPLQWNIHKLYARLSSTASPPFPFIMRQLCVLLVMTRCQGEGELWLRVYEVATGRTVFRDPPRRVRFAGALEDISGIVFRIKQLRFERPGRYHVDVVYSGQVLATQPFFVAPQQP